MQRLTAAVIGSKIERRVHLLGMWFRDLEHFVRHNGLNLTAEDSDRLDAVWSAWIGGNVERFARVQLLYAIERAAVDEDRGFDGVRAARNTFRTYAQAIGVEVPSNELMREALDAWRSTKKGKQSKWHRLAVVCQQAGFRKLSADALKVEWNENRPGFRLPKWKPTTKRKGVTKRKR